jgi:hypothetical protein
LAAATAAAFVVSFVMAWSPVQRSNAGIIWVQQPGDYANQISTTLATGRLTMLRPALDHNINGVLESVPSVGIKL